MLYVVVLFLSMESQFSVMEKKCSSIALEFRGKILVAVNPELPFEMEAALA
jgi:hypothetical protein